MAEADRSSRRIRTFEDLAEASDELLRQLATRVHVVDLAYAFDSADEALLERLLGSVRPGLAEQIRSAIRTIQASADRFPPQDQIRSARAKVMDIARSEMLLNF